MPFLEDLLVVGLFEDLDDLEFFEDLAPLKFLPCAELGAEDRAPDGAEDVDG